MTAYPRHAFDVAPGQPQPTVFTPLAQFFRRLVAAVRRKPAAPEAPSTPSGAATTLLTGRFPCCEHCALEDLSQCDPPDNHLTPCSDGCSDALGNRMISEVRAERNRPAPRPAPAGWATAVRDGVRVLVPPVPVPGRPPWETAPFAPVPPQAAPRPVNGRPLGTQPRRQPGAARAAGLRDRERYEPASVPLLRQVLGALRNLDTPAAGYRGGWQ